VNLGSRQVEEEEFLWNRFWCGGILPSLEDPCGESQRTIQSQALPKRAQKQTSKLLFLGLCCCAYEFIVNFLNSFRRGACSFEYSLL